MWFAVLTLILISTLHPAVLYQGLRLGAGFLLMGSPPEPLEANLRSTRVYESTIPGYYRILQ